MHKADAHPVNHQSRRTFADFGKPARQSFFRRGVRDNFGKIPGQGELDQAIEQRHIIACRRQFEMSEARERGGDTADDRAGFFCRMSIVKHVAYDRLARDDQRQGARGRHAQVVHGLAA